jgi:SSS family solute:Na+ symporter
MRLLVFALIALPVVWIGFRARRWRAANLGELDEWALGGRRLGSFLTWFLLGGDLYTAYTFIAVPALIFGAGALGLFALSYTIIAFPVGFLLLPPLWRACKRAGHVTVADFVGDRHASSSLARAVAFTGVLATLPYVALQLIGLELAFPLLGMPFTGPLRLFPLILAFGLLAAFTYTSGLRAPVWIAVVKDLLVYVLVFALVVLVPLALGGWEHVFAAVPPERILLPRGKGLDLGPPAAFVTLALGSALALFLYPHAVTGALGAKSAGTVRRNMMLLPAYSFVLGLLLLLGYAATVVSFAGHPEAEAGLRAFGPDDAIPALMLVSLPRWLVGVGAAALVAGALVPASVMSIASANLVVRNLLPRAGKDAGAGVESSRWARRIALGVMTLALLLVLTVPFSYAIDFQLLGGVWILQTLPAVGLAFARRRPPAVLLLAGWLVGIASGTWFVAATGFHGVVVSLHLGPFRAPCYAALLALVLNLLTVGTGMFLGAVAKASYRHGRCCRVADTAPGPWPARAPRDPGRGSP